MRFGAKIFYTEVAEVRSMNHELGYYIRCHEYVENYDMDAIFLSKYQLIEAVSMSDRGQYHTCLLQTAIMSLCSILYPEGFFYYPVLSLINKHVVD